METHPNTIELAAFASLTVAWILFGVVFLVGRSGAAPRGSTTFRSTKSRLGLILQLIAYALVFTFGRDPRLAPIIAMSSSAETFLLILATVIGFASIVLCLLSARTLGKQWSLVARLVTDHELVQQGPYALVRHPIYLAMFGLLIQAGIVLADWRALVSALVLFLVGTRIRIGEEEQILHRKFGRYFEEYVRRVPSFMPRLWPRRLFP